MLSWHCLGSSLDQCCLSKASLSILRQVLLCRLMMEGSSTNFPSFEELLIVSNELYSGPLSLECNVFGHTVVDLGADIALG